MLMIAHNYLTVIHPLALGLLWIWTKLITHNIMWRVCRCTCALCRCRATTGHYISNQGPGGGWRWHHCPAPVTSSSPAARASNEGSEDLTITEKAPNRGFSWLKVPTSAFTFKTLSRHYALLKLVRQCKEHNANQTLMIFVSVSQFNAYLLCLGTRLA